MKRPWLAPLTPLYAAGAALRARTLSVRRLGWPVVSVGNLSAGGAGKTPLTMELVRLLSARGVHVDVLSRGYGRVSGSAARVLPDGTAEAFGDEPLLIARAAHVPVYVAAQRYDAGVLAEHESEQHIGLRVHLLDDGFQHRQLARAVDVLLVNREDWFDTLLPAGNLREPRNAALRASVLAIPAEDAALEDELRAWGWSGPVWRLRRSMDVAEAIGPALAFCGIARPAQFFAGLEQAGVKIAARRSYRDHHRYTRHDVEMMIAQARAAGARALMTTEKDAVRLGVLAEAFPAELPLRMAALSCAIEDENTAMDWLLARLKSAQAV